MLPELKATRDQKSYPVSSAGAIHGLTNLKVKQEDLEGHNKEQCSPFQ